MYKRQVEAKVIDKAGSWYSFDGNRIGQGRENVKKYMEDNPEIFEQVEQLLLDSLKQKDEKKNDDEAADIPVSYTHLDVYKRQARGRSQDPR